MEVAEECNRVSGLYSQQASLHVFPWRNFGPDSHLSIPPGLYIFPFVCIHDQACPAKTASQTQKAAHSHRTWTRSTRVASYSIQSSLPLPPSLFLIHVLVAMPLAHRPYERTREQLFSPQKTASAQPSAKSSTSIALQPSCLAMAVPALSQAWTPVAHPRSCTTDTSAKTASSPLSTTLPCALRQGE